MRALTLITTLVFFFSCSQLQKKDKLNKAPAPVIQQLEVAKKHYVNKKYNQTVKILSGILKFYRNTDTGDDALFLLAKTYSRQENWPKALNAYTEMYNSQYYSSREFLARIAAAKILNYKMSKPAKALKLIDQSLALKPRTEQRAELMEVRFSTLMKTGSQLEAFETLVELAEKHPNVAKRSSFKKKAKAFLDIRLSGPELKDFANDRSSSLELRIDAMYRYGVLLMGEGQYSKAKDYFHRVIEMNPKSYAANQSKKLMSQIEARGKIHPRTVGVILPLSGRYSQIGYQTLWGIQLALGIKGGRNENNLRLAVIDSRGRPEYARSGVKRLVEEDHVIAIVGGLLSKTAYSASIQSQDLGVPFLALSQREGLTDIGPFIFRNALTIGAQLDTLIETAFNKLKFKRFAILFPNDEYGVKISNLFWKKIREKGGTITGAQSYLPGETDFNEPIRKLVGTFYVEDREEEYGSRLKEWYEKHPKKSRHRKKPPVGLLPPIVDFDAIFIPDGPKAIGQIAPTLAYNDIQKVYLIGTNIWNSHEFVRRGQNFVNFTLFTDGFYQQDQGFINSKFYQTYFSTFKKLPSSFSLLGYDSGLVIRTGLSRNAQSRLDFVKSINQSSGVPGALNTLMLNNKKEFVRPVVSLTVKEGAIVPFKEDTFDTN